MCFDQCFLGLKSWLHLTAGTLSFLITVLESSGNNEKAYIFFQISAKNRGVDLYGEAELLNVKTQEKG
jgi:hypothetical protein